MLKTISKILAVMMLSAIVTPALAGGYCEGGDSGRTVITAQSVVGASGSVTSISGTLAGGALRAGDFEDVFEIFISDPASFSATTVNTANFNTELFLFDPAGLGLLANDDTAGIPILSGSTLPNAANDGSGASVIVPGNYFLAITGKGNKPTSNGASLLLIFNQVVPTEVSGPDGPGDLIQDGWSVGSGPVGTYQIVLTGVSFFEPIPATSHWGLMALAVAILGGGLVILRRRYVIQT